MSLGVGFRALNTKDPEIRSINEALLYLYSKVDPSDVVVTSDSTVANTVTETSIFTETVQARNFFPGRVVRTVILGYYSKANGTVTFDARLKIGGTTVDTLTSPTGNKTNAGFQIEFTCTVRSAGTSGSIISHTMGLYDGTNKSDANTSTVAVNTEIANDIELTIEWSAADPGNTITVTQGYTQFIG